MNAARNPSVWLFAVAVTSMLITLTFVVLVFGFGPTLTYPNQPFPLENTTVKAGSSVVLLVDRCAREPFGPPRLTVTFLRNLVLDGTSDRMAIPPGSNDIEQGCEPTSRRSTTIPADLKPGRYFIEILSTIYGRFRTATVYARSQTFEVVAP